MTLDNRIILRSDSDLKEILKYLRTKTGMSTSNMIRDLIIDYYHKVSMGEIESNALYKTNKEELQQYVTHMRLYRR